MRIDFYTAIKTRRSTYSIDSESTIPDERISEIVKEAVKHSPTAFNSQSGRVILLLGDNHIRLWDMAKDALKKIVPEENFRDTEEKINSFRNGYGTILYFEDEDIIRGLQEKFSLYKENFPIWAHQSAGMLQYIIWTSLEIEGLGASLQHYNPLIDDEVKREWDIQDSWRLIGQMPFGKPLSVAKEKEFIPMDERVKIYK